MRNIWLIAKREYLERVRTRAFLISTLMIPLLMVGGIVGSVLGTGRTRQALHITIVSRDQQVALDLQKELEGSKADQIVADVISPGNTATKAALDSMLADGQIDGYLWITQATHPNARPTFSYTPRSSADIAAKAAITMALRTVLMRERLAHNGMVANDVDSLMEPVKVDTTQAGKNAESTSSYVAIYVLFFLMYMVILLYGMNVARSIIEEKTSRVFEVLLATITPEEMMAGKVIGVGSVGLTQVAVWLLTAILLTSGSWLQAVAGHSVHFALSAPQLIYFVVFFLLGYLLYSSIAAALGAMVNSEQELQQLNMFLVMPLAGCMFALAPVISNPSGPVARIISLIPFCTPLIMYLRISLAPPPAWEIALSILLMIATIYAILWCASRIYRVGILMYGKRPNLSEIMRWLKYS
ncbi:MAG TPA: ABC transporter permease [Edaphobacter sp.]|nr:ABC transporter permease [Edaphobacter sp.]